MTTTASPAASSAPDGLAVRGLARRFGRRWALAGISVDLPRGVATMVTGANGSGKTTLLRCLSTALKPHQGSVLWNGRDLWAERGALRPGISFLSHQTRLYEDLSAPDNVRVWARLGGYTPDVDALLGRVGLPADRTDPVRTFSAGMRRRLSLALFLLKRVELGLFDEPFSAMDPAGQELVRDVIRELVAGGSTVVVATHLPDYALSCCSWSVHLDQGHVRRAGPA